VSRSSAAPRALLSASCAVALGGLPLGVAADPLALLAWLALAAVPLGILCGARGLALWPWSAMVPAGWMILFALASAFSERAVPAPHGPALVLCGAFLCGWALGRGWPAAAWSSSGLAWALLALASALPMGLWIQDGAFPPAATARLFDLSPVTLVIESAGVDWLRHPLLYETARTYDIGPELRGPFRANLAGPVCLLVGCLGAWLAARARPPSRA